MNPRAKINLHRWINVFLIFGSFIALILGWTMPPSFSEVWQAWTVIWITACSLIHVWLRYSSGDRDLLSPDKLFIIAYFYFHFDYLVSYLLGLTDYRNDVFAFPKYANLTTYLISLCLFFFLVGYNLKHQSNDQKSLSGAKQFYLRLDWRTLLAGKMMILVGFVFVVIFVFQIGLSTLLNRDYGFNLFYSGEYSYSFFSQGKSIIAVGIIFFVLDWFRTVQYSIKQKLINLFLLTVIAMYVMAIFFLFSVRSWLLLDVFMPALLIYHYFHRKISIKSLLIALLVVFVISVAIEISRTTSTRTLSGFIHEFYLNQASKQYQFSDVLTTQWHTYKNVNKSLALIATENHWFYGSTLLGGFFESIPFASKYLNTAWYENPSIWLARNLEPWYYDHHEGIGFSLPAEMYINFGLLGAALIFLILGYLCAHIYAKVYSLVSVILYVTFLPNLLFSIRQTVSSFMRPVIIAILITLIIQCFARLIKVRSRF